MKKEGYTSFLFSFVFSLFSFLCNLNFPRRKHFCKAMRKIIFY